MPVTAPQSAIGYAFDGAGVQGWWQFDPDETTPELRWPQSITVYDAMRKQDAQVGSVLEAVTRPVLRTPWRIDPAGARSEVVEFVAEDLGLPIIGQNPKPPPRTKDRFSWLEHLELALLMLPYGHMYFEQEYRITDDGTRAHLRKLAPRMPRTIESIDVARDGGLVSITQYSIMGQSGPSKPITVDRLVAYVYKREGANWLGRSILRQAYKNWLIKDRLLRVQAQTIERNGMGIPDYEAAEGESSLAAGLALTKALRAGETAGTARPNGSKLRLMGVEGTLPDALPAIEYHDSQIARAVLAHFLNLGTQTGSWALGTTFADFFTLSLQTLAQQVADTCTQHVVEDIVDVNWGPTEPAPRVTFDEIGSRQAATAQALKALVDAGVIRPDQVLEEMSRQQYGLPPADPNSAFPTEGEAGPKEPGAEDDDEPDEDTNALLDAMEAISPRAVKAAFDPGKHPRNPKGSPGGGRFKSLTQRLTEALKQHLDGNGDADPFDGFDREQLRKAAKARGIDLKRGEDRDSIAKKLLADLSPGGSSKRDTATPPKAPKVPARPKTADAPKVSKRPDVKPADSARIASLQERIAKARAEALPISDEVAKWLEGHQITGASEQIRRLQDLKKLRDKADPATRELLDALIERDGSPFGGDFDFDSRRWMTPPAWDVASRREGAPMADAKARDRYVVTDSNTITQNASLRTGEPTPEAKRWAARMRRMVRATELNNDTVVYRGAAMPPEQIAALRPGAVIHDLGILSTDLDQRQAEFYADTRLERTPGTIKTMFQVRVPKGTPAANVGFGEVVLDHGSRFRVVSSRMDDSGVVHVVIEHVSGGG